MTHDGARSKGGTMPVELREKVDRLLDEFMAQVDTISQNRNLQKGIARSQLPCDMLAAKRSGSLRKIAMDHIDSEFIRFSSLISLLRTRPIFGAVPATGSPSAALLILPSSDAHKTSQIIIQVTEAERLPTELAQDVRRGKSAIREVWGMGIYQRGKDCDS